MASNVVSGTRQAATNPEPRSNLKSQDGLLKRAFGFVQIAQNLTHQKTKTMKKLERIDMTNTKLTCLRCGFTWTPRTDKPAACPACKSYRWNIAPKLKPQTNER